MRVAPRIELTQEEEKELKRLARSNTVSVRLARRARIVLLAAAGYTNRRIAEQMGVGRIQVGRWRERYAREALSGIERDLPRGGRRRVVDAQRIVRLTTQSTPEQATHWSSRRIA